MIIPASGVMPDAHEKHCCLNCGCQFDFDELCTVVQGEREQINRCGSIQCKVS